MADDPYAGIGSVVSAAPQADPYAGIGSPVADTKPDAPGWQQLAAGAAKGLTGLPDLLGNLMNPGKAVDEAMELDALRHNPQFQAVAKQHGLTVDQAIEQAKAGRAPETAQYWLHKGLGLLGLNPDDVKATTAKSRIEQGIGMGLSGAVIPSGEAMTVGNLLRSGVIGAAAGGGAAVAQESAPDELKPVAGLAAGLASGLVAHGGLRGAETALRPVGAAVGRAVSPLAAAVTPRDAGLTAEVGVPASRVAGQSAADLIRARSSEPRTVAELLAQPQEDLVPGSKPTTFQATGDLGLGQLERQVSTQAPDLFKAREAEQDVARVGALQDIQRDADPNAVAGAIRGNLDALDTATQAHIDELTAAAQEKAGKLAAGSTPEALGAATREAITEAEGAARAREGALWRAIDPDNNLTGNMLTTRTAAREIAAEIPKTAKPMAGEPAAIFDTAAQLEPLGPVSDLTALRSRVSEEMRNELIANGRTQTYARLARLRGAIQDNLANTIAHQVATEDAVAARGGMAEESTVGARLRAWVDDYRQRQAGEASVAGGAGSGAAAAEPVAAGAGADGTGLPGQGGPGGAASDQGVPPDGGLNPTFDEAAAQRLAEATAATRERAKTFGLNPISPVTAKAGPSDVFRLPEAQVPEKFFHRGFASFGHIQGLYAAIGKEAATKLLGEYAALSLRRAAMNENGVLDPVRYRRWANDHADALRALPSDLKASFAEAASASREIATATAERAARLKEAQAGALGRVMGRTEPDDVTRTIGTVLGSQTAVADFKRLADAVKGNPEARAGLRQAVVDHMLSRVLSNAEAGTTGVNALKGDTFQTFFARARPALAQVFTPQELDSMEAVAKDVQRGRRSIAATKLPGGSNTPQDISAALRGGKLGHGALRTILNAFMAAGGFEVHGSTGAIAALLGSIGVQSLRDVGISRIDQLVTHAMLHPEVAGALLKRFPPRANVGAGLSFAQALRKSAAAAGITSTAK